LAVWVFGVCGFVVCGFTACVVVGFGGLFAEPPPLPWACTVTVDSNSAAVASTMFQRFM
jgi:hypothetical protein